MVAIVNAAVAGAVADTETCAGEKLHVVPAGRPLQLSETVPVNAFAGATLMVSTADAPGATLATCDDALRLNVAGEVALVEFAIEPNNPCVSPSVPAVK